MELDFSGNNLFKPFVYDGDPNEVPEHIRKTLPPGMWRPPPLDPDPPKFLNGDYVCSVPDETCIVDPKYEYKHKSEPVTIDHHSDPSGQLSMKSILNGESTMKIYNIAFPPYNPMGPLAHIRPKDRDDYVITDNVGWRKSIWAQAVAYRKYSMPNKHKLLVRGHADEPTKSIFCEYEEGHEMTINYKMLRGRFPILTKHAWSLQDGVLGLYIEWRNVRDAEWFLYHHNTEGLLLRGPHDHAVMVPPRFVHEWEDAHYSSTPCIGIDLNPPVKEPSDSATHANVQLTTSFPYFDVQMARLDPLRWKNMPTEWRKIHNTESPSQFKLPRRRQGEMRGRNAIVPNRVRDGLDVRTTVMVRNLPDNFAYEDLKALLDKHCLGRYDFLYLRTNFETGINVGYGFVNLINGVTLLRLWHAVHGFPLTPSEDDQDKTIELLYADVQGIDALFDRFQNSAIMQGPYNYRPHAYYTVAEAIDYNDIDLVGKERPFPLPNNLARLDRSIARTQAEGLFTRGSKQRHQRGTQTASVAPRNGTPTVAAALGAVLGRYQSDPRGGDLLAYIQQGGY